MNVLVLGAAVSGIAAARLARRHGHDVAVYDQNAAAVARLHGEGFTIHSGAWTTRLLHDVDLVVTSPGIPEHVAPIQDTIGAGVPLVSEMEYAARHLDVPYLAVTGTNGKTTVTEVTAEMLTASGIAATPAGNIGTALSDVVGATWEVVVVEASSFQLRFVDTFHPRGAAITNIAPDHLDWHGTHEAYVGAKANIFGRMGDGDVVTYDADDAGAREVAGRCPVPLIAVSGSTVTPDGYGVAGDRLRLGDIDLPAPDVGAPFLADLAMAAVLARAAGADADAVASVAGSFRPGAHRRSVVGERAGVRFVDDSKATNPHAAVASAASYATVILIAGGRNKGLDLAPLAVVPTVKLLIGLGEAADELAAAADGVTPFLRAADMDDAVALAVVHAEPGDVVLLAPGCASFDMFDSYAARGDAFTDAVRRLEGAA